MDAASHQAAEQCALPTRCDDRRGAQADRAEKQPDASFKVGHDGYTLTLVRTQVREPEILAFELEPLELALLVESPLIVMFYRLGTRAPWAHVPYAWPLSDGAAGTDSTVRASRPANHRGRLQLRLVDSGSGQVLAERFLGLDTDFSTALGVALAAQVQTPFDGHAYMRALCGVAFGTDDPCRMLARAAARTVAND